MSMWTLLSNHRHKKTERIRIFLQYLPTNSSTFHRRILESKLQGHHLESPFFFYYNDEVRKKGIIYCKKFSLSNWCHIKGPKHQSFVFLFYFCVFVFFLRTTVIMSQETMEKQRCNSNSKKPARRESTIGVVLDAGVGSTRRPSFTWHNRHRHTCGSAAHRYALRTWKCIPTNV